MPATTEKHRTKNRQRSRRPLSEFKTQLLPIRKMLPTSDNRRRPITKASVESLARSMKDQGVIQPIVVRPHPKRSGFFEIRAGERRWYAAKAAKLTHLPAIVRDMDDEAALSVTLAENIQRENFHPLEEAATIQIAFDRGHDIKTVAAHLGKPVHYIARRASLNRLAEIWKREILRPESDASRLSATHLELIARLPEETQNALAENDFGIFFARGFPTIVELRRITEGGMHVLKSAPWGLDDETLDPKAGSCENCPKRSGKQPLLFDDEAATENGTVSKTDRCLDPSCYDRKRAAHLGRCEVELREAHPTLRVVQVTYQGLSPAMQATFGDRLTRAYQPIAARPNQTGATPSMPVDGPKAGTLVHLVLGETDSRRKHAKGRARDKTGKVVPLTMTERRAALKRRRDAFVVKRIEAMLKAMTEGDLKKTVGRLENRSDSAAKAFDILALTLAFGTTTRADRISHAEAWTLYDRLRKETLAVRTVGALHQIVQIWTRRLSGTDGSIAATQMADARRMCELLEIDTSSLEREAAIAIPEPKSWRHAR